MTMKKPEDQKISNVPPFGLRMLPDLRARIEQAAADSGRSMNAEIIARLEQSFDPIIVNVRETGDMYGELEKIVERVIRKVRSEEESHS